MPQCDTFSVLLLVGVCLSAWAAPLGSTSSPQARRCNKKEQESRETSDHLGGLQDDRLCVLPASSPRVQEWQEPGGGAEVSARDEGEFSVTNVKKGLVQKGVEAHARSQKGSSESTDVSLVDKNSTDLPATPTESVSVVARTISGLAIKEMEPVTSPNVGDQMKHAVQKVGLSVVPFWLSTDRPAETQVILGHSDFDRPGSLLYTSLRDDKGSVQLLTRDLPQEQEGGIEVETAKRNQSEQLSQTEPPFMVSSSASQSPWTIISPATIAPSDISDGEDRGSRAVEESLFTATELQDKALAPGLLQPDLTLSSRLPELGGTWTEPLHFQGGEAIDQLHFIT